MAFTRTIQGVQGLIDDGVVPGVSYALLNQRDVITGTIGAQQLVPSYQALKEGQLYDVASLTKVVGTVPVIMQLIAAKRVRLEDSISAYLKDWRDRRVTIRHLLTHTSGITGYIVNRDELSASQLTKALLNLHVGPTFDKQMVYSDTNFIFLGWIAEAILGAPIQTLIQQRVLAPLGMNDSTFSPENPLDCVPTEVSTKRGLIRGEVHDPKAFVLKQHCGSAGLFATRADLITFTQAMLNASDEPFTNELKEQLPLDQTPHQKAYRSFGWALVPVQFPAPHYAIWHSGFTGTFLVIDPTLQQAMIFLSNRIHPIAPNDVYLGRRNAIINTFLTEKIGEL